MPGGELAALTEVGAVPVTGRVVPHSRSTAEVKPAVAKRYHSLALIQWPVNP